MPHLNHNLAQRTLEQLLGANRGSTLLIIVSGLVAIGWFTDSIFELLGIWLDGDEAGSYWRLSIGVLVFPVLLASLYLLTRKARQQLRPSVAEDCEPRQVRGLVLCLSNLWPKDYAGIQEALSADTALTLASFREQFSRLPWRMGVEAIAYHHGRIDHLCVVTSRDKNGEGSQAQYAMFVALVEQLFPDSLNIETLTDFAPQHAQGLCFERDAEDLADAIDSGYRHLRERWKLPASDILIDVTGGQKPTTLVGVAVALAEGRQVQYVSTHDYRPTTFDLDYETT